MIQLAYVMTVYRGSDGGATTRLYNQLERIVPAGIVAINLFRAQKCSERAKVYRGRHYRDAAYNRKQWSMDLLCQALLEHGQKLSIEWGWGEDSMQEYHRHVLYVELPCGQVSFHTDKRGQGPDAPRPWDGIRMASPQRICAWVATVLESGNG